MGGNHIETVVNPTDTTGDENENAFLTKFSPDGELLWNRTYHYLNVPDDKHELYDLKATTDGGYIFCGQATDLVPYWEMSEPPYQQGWLVKVDGHGCLVEGCEQFDNVSEITAPDTPYFLAGPNPASSFINLYPSHPLAQGSTFKLYTITGQLLGTFDAAFGAGSTLILDVSTYPPGHYTLVLEDQGQVVQQVKVVVE